MRLRLLPEVIDPRLFVYYVHGSQLVRDYVRSVNHGATRDGINTEQLLDLPVLLPPPIAQPGIVAAIESHFSRLDAATATLERVQRNLERYRASVLKAAVEGRLVPTEAELAKKEGRIYEPASVLLKRILAERRRRWEEAELAKLKAKGKPPTDDRWKAKYEEPATPETDGLRQLPDGWCWASVDQCFEILPGVGIPESVQGTAGRPIPIFKVGEISRAWQRGERFIHSSANTLDEAQALDLTRHLFPAETIVFAKIGAALALNRRAITATPSVIDNNCMGLACVSSDVSLLYAFHFLCTVRLGDLAKATTVPSVRKTEVARLPVPLPPRSEQVRIASQVDRVLSVADEARGTVKAGLVRSSRLRQSILKCAFEGRLVQAATEQGLRDFPRTGRR